MRSREPFDVIVIGGGVQGLAVCYHLSKNRELKVGLLEQFTIGHCFGSSHGYSRIVRSVYSNPVYIQLMQRARSHEWPQLEKAIGKPLIYPTPGCRFGRGEVFENCIKAASEYGLQIDLLAPSDARKRFPQFTFHNVNVVMQDNTAGLIAAKETLEGLARLVAEKGVAIHENTQVSEIVMTHDPIEIISNEGTFFTKKLVITAGPWTGELVPDLKKRLTPIRQTVGYYELEGEKSSYQLGQFPVWSFIGDNENQLFYGLPEFGQEGIKIAQHMTHGRVDHPQHSILKGITEQLSVLEQFIEEQFAQPIRRFVDSETCFYTSTPSEDFILDLLPQDQRIAIGSACSGHGFKFAPLTGLILAQLITEGRTTIAEFERARPLFSI